MRTTRLIRALAGAMLGLMLLIAPAPAASAHPAQTSGVFVTVHDDAAHLQLQIPIDRLALATGLDLDGTEATVEENEEAIDAYLLANMRLADENGELEEALGALSVATVNEAPALVVDVEAIPDDGSVDGDVALDYTVVIGTVAGHDAYIALISDWEGGQVEEGEPEVLAVLDYSRTSTTIERGSASWWTGMKATIGLGMSHIAEGTDHLLFLGTLLLAAPLVAARSSKGWRWANRRGIGSTVCRTALIVTAFTIGHTLSLALVSFGLVSFPTTPVELLVAASIIVAAVHAIKPLIPRGEIVMAAIFGLVHGTAFATTILELQLNTSSTVSAVLGFNIGVELAQLTAVALTLPLLMLLTRTSAYRHVRIGVAAVAIIAATAWIAGILQGSDSVLTPVFDAIAARPVLSYAVATGLTVTIWAFAPRREEGPPAPEANHQAGVLSPPVGSAR